MIECYCLGSSSAGNCYIFKFNPAEVEAKEGRTSPTYLMVEAGLSYKDILKKCNQDGIDFSLISKCLITHAHADHSKCAKDLEARGITIYASDFTIKSLGLKNAVELKSQTKADIGGGLEVISFDVVHDCEGSLGFFIEYQKADDSVLFINDCYKVEFDLSCFAPKLIFIECNHDDQRTHICFNQALKDGDAISIKRYERIMKSHLGEFGCKKILGTINLSRCRSIMLMHLSDMNSNEYKMKEEIHRFTNIPTLVCGKNGGIK